MRSAVVVLIACTVARSALAQGEAPVIRPQQRARITAPSIESVPMVGKVVAIDSTAVMMLPYGAYHPTPVPFTAITRAEQSMGRHHGRWAAAGAGLGLMGGVMVGAVVATTARDAALAPIGFGFGGLIGGTLFGAAAAPERWREAVVRPPE